MRPADVIKISKDERSEKRLMAKCAGVSTWQVEQVWKAADLKPHRLKVFKISNDPNFAEKVVDVVGLYLDPPANAMVLSVDEKTQIQAIERPRFKPGLFVIRGLCCISPRRALRG